MQPLSFSELLRGLLRFMIAMAVFVVALALLGALEQFSSWWWIVVVCAAMSVGRDISRHKQLAAPAR